MPAWLSTAAWLDLRLGRLRPCCNAAVMLKIPMGRSLAGCGGSVNNLAYRRPLLTCRGELYAESTSSNPSYSSGEGAWGRGASLGEAASLAVPSLSPATLHGRGGSVSRRDHNLAYRRPPLTRRGILFGESPNLNPSYSSGGSAREGLLLEKPPPSQYLRCLPSRCTVAAALSAAVTIA